MEQTEQIEIQIDVKTEAKAKKVMSRLRLRSLLKAMLKEGLITAYEVTHWTGDYHGKVGEVVISSTEPEAEGESE